MTGITCGSCGGGSLGAGRRGWPWALALGRLACAMFVTLTVARAESVAVLPAEPPTSPVVATAPEAVPAVQAPASRPADLAALEVVADATISEWKPIFVGIELCEATTAKPRPLQIRAVRIDTRAPGIRFIVTPDNGELPGEVSSRRSTRFLEEFKCQVAINASFFAGKYDQPDLPQDIVGLTIAEGKQYSEPNEFAALLISRTNRCRISRPPFEIRNAWNAVAGDTLLLEDGKIVPEAVDGRSRIANALHPRSAAGISRGGRYLYLMTVDGRQPGYSEGTSKLETAEWLRKLGAWDGLNLDGGHSTNLVMEGPDGKPVLINHPASEWLRFCANHLGVCAKRLPQRRE